MAYDPYKCLLANASREHVKRNADMNTHLVGNVFLPAIDPQRGKQMQPSAATSASFKHLKVIEQCIAAENKREEQLARCASQKERQLLTKRFQAQRDRERELISALMIGKSPNELYELQLLEAEQVIAVTATATATTSLTKKQLKQETTGLAAKTVRPDRVFRKAKATGGVPQAKPHAHKKFKLPKCNGSPGEKGNLRAQAAAAAALASSAARGKPNEGSSSTREFASDPFKSSSGPKRSSSKSASSTRSPWLVREQSQGISTNIEASRPSETIPLPEKRARSPYISPQRLQQKGVRSVPPLAALPSTPVKAGIVESCEETVGVVTFEGARSFSEAHLLALGSPVPVVKQSEKSRSEVILTEMSTQTTARQVEEKEAQVEDDELLEPSEKVFQRRDELRDSDRLLHDVDSQKEASTSTRPHSSPAVRSSSQSVLDALAALSEETLTKLKEAAKDSGVGDPQEDEVEMVGEEPGDEVAMENAGEASAQLRENSNADAEKSIAISKGSGLSIVVSEEDPYDEELETDVAEVLFDLVDLVAEAAIAMAAAAAAQKEAEEEAREVELKPRTVSPRPRQDIKLQEEAATRIQALFRGHHARVAFRLALYEDALSCGVLGAMPGTMQGQTGWYQDPKSLMAYYFSIPTLDGDWEQQLVLRCTRLVLTPYEMRQEVLSKVAPVPQQ